MIPTTHIFLIAIFTLIFKRLLTSNVFIYFLKLFNSLIDFKWKDLLCVTVVCLVMVRENGGWNYFSIYCGVILFHSFAFSGHFILSLGDCLGLCSIVKIGMRPRWTQMLAHNSKWHMLIRFVVRGLLGAKLPKLNHLMVGGGG